MPIPAIDKAAQVLGRLAETGEPMTFGQVAESVSLPRSSLHDVCTSLAEVGLLERGSDGTFRLGLRLVELARARLASSDLVSTFRRVCRTADIQETTVLAVLNGPEVVYVAFIDGGRPLAVRYQIGMRLPATTTATGKSILATLPEREVEPLLDSGSAPLADSDYRELVTELEATRLRGFSIDDEKTAAGMVCFGAPVFDGTSDIACGAVAFSMVKTTALSTTECTQQIREIADAVSRELGGTRQSRVSRAS
ncbi:IclR family transcriptional regulator [Qaidamihabitans albus]|uniref:IclR family transcriptional regulator n=1 Tax=Qaidamihabitans albus TaxID=2795733 RepID=UPI0018F175B6|nr:IclR family transcriptional regulator [Qaidamihabitans albus]